MPTCVNLHWSCCKRNFDWLPYLVPHRHSPAPRNITAARPSVASIHAIYAFGTYKVFGRRIQISEPLSSHCGPRTFVNERPINKHKLVREVRMAQKCTATFQRSEHLCRDLLLGADQRFGEPLPCKVTRSSCLSCPT